MEKDNNPLTQLTSRVLTILTDCKDVETLACYAFKLPDWLKKKYLLKDLKVMTLGNLQQLVMVIILSLQEFLTSGGKADARVCSVSTIMFTNAMGFIYTVSMNTMSLVVS